MPQKIFSPWENTFTVFAGALYWCFIYLFEHLVNEKTVLYFQ